VLIKEIKKTDLFKIFDGLRSSTSYFSIIQHLLWIHHKRGLNLLLSEDSMWLAESISKGIVIKNYVFFGI